MKRTFILTVILFQLPYIMFAHGSHGSDFIAGFTHPILGLDHSLAILGIGTLAYYLDSNRWFFYPFSFLIMMIIGGILGIGQEASFMIEKVIALSVFIIGITHLRKVGSGSFFLIAIIALFGFFHGYAHGVEMPETTTAIKYISGFSIGVILLSMVGYLLSKRLESRSNSDLYSKMIAGFFDGSWVRLFVGVVFATLVALYHSCWCLR